MKGRLHTRYSPIRHSPATEVPLPFDLHVLGLPLAFILSQDQTLHRYFFRVHEHPILFNDQRKFNAPVLWYDLFSFVRDAVSGIPLRCQSNMLMNLSSVFVSPANSFAKRVQI